MVARFAVTNNDYRYGFNGKEHEDDLTGGDYDFGARIYDPRLGRWLAIDILFKTYPDLAPYAFVGNCPISFVDSDGRKIEGVTYNKKTKIFTYSPEAEARGTRAYIEARIKTVEGTQAINELITDTYVYKISVTDRILVSDPSEEDGKRVVASGITQPLKYIVVSTNDTKTEDLINGGAADDIIEVSQVNEKGDVVPLQIKRGDLKLPNLTETEEDKQYSAAKEESGYNAYYADKANAEQTNEEKIHNYGAHEEVHLYQEQNLNTKEAETPAFENQVKAAKNYRDPTPSTTPIKK